MFLHADSEDSDHTGQMLRMIRVFDGRTGQFVGFVMRRLKYFANSFIKTHVIVAVIIINLVSIQLGQYQGSMCIKFMKQRLIHQNRVRGFKRYKDTLTTTMLMICTKSLSNLPYHKCVLSLR